MKQLLLDYANKKIDAITTIRTLSGMFHPEHAVDILSIICQITRVEQNDLDRETFKSIFGL